MRLATVRGVSMVGVVIVVGVMLMMVVMVLWADSSLVSSAPNCPAPSSVATGTVDASLYT